MSDKDAPIDCLHAICPHLSRSLCPPEDKGGVEFPDLDVDLINTLTTEQTVRVFNAAVELVEMNQEKGHAKYDSGALLNAFVINPLFGRLLSALTRRLEELECPATSLNYFRLREVYESVKKNEYPYDLDPNLYRRISIELARFGAMDTKPDRLRNLALWGNKHLVLDNIELATRHDLLYAACWGFGPVDRTVIDAMTLDQTVEMFNHMINCDDTVCWNIARDDTLTCLSDKLEDMKCPVDRLVDFDTLCELELDCCSINYKLSQRVARAAALGGKRILQCLREKDDFKLGQLTGALKKGDKINRRTAIALGRLIFEKLKRCEVYFDFTER